MPSMSTPTSTESWQVATPEREPQKLADRLVAAGYVGLRTPSFAQGAEPDDLNLVLWRWGDPLPSRVLLIDDEGPAGFGVTTSQLGGRD